MTPHIRSASLSNIKGEPTERRRGLSRLGYRGLVAVVVVSLALLGSAAVAVADPGTPNVNQASSAVYPDPDNGQVLGTGGNGNIANPAGTATDTGSGLPFTGFFAPALLGAGLLLLGAGFGMRRVLSSKSSPAHQ